MTTIPHTSIEQAQAAVVEDFSQFVDWMEKYEYLIELGKGLEPLPAAYKSQDFLIEGCQSRVWLVPKLQDGLLFFLADSDAIITKGIISLLIGVFSGRRPAEIAAAPLHFLEEIGLKDHLSPTRANGLAAMVEKIKAYAAAMTE